MVGGEVEAGLGGGGVACSETGRCSARDRFSGRVR